MKRKLAEETKPLSHVESERRKYYNEIEDMKGSIRVFARIRPLAQFENQPQIPYRDNTLTELLSDSIGGNAKTLMFVNLSPASDNLSETESSLRFAQRVKKVTNQPLKTVETKAIKVLKKKLSECKEHVVTAH